MEVQNIDGGDMGGSGSGAPGSFRWNPTKEQISMLENLYTQGIRTPSAEHIQQITSRLKVYGHIEGKNVFYWFQNHKARQRQKQKQHNLASLNRFLHHTTTPSIFPLPCQNVVCGPYYRPQTSENFGFYHQYPKMLIPSTSGYESKSRLDGYASVPHEYNNLNPNPTMMNRRDCMYQERMNNTNINGNCHQETLDLFPLNPMHDMKIVSLSSVENISEDSEDGGEENINVCMNEGSMEQPFIDFFSRPAGSYESS